MTRQHHIESIRKAIERGEYAIIKFKMIVKQENHCHFVREIAELERRQVARLAHLERLTAKKSF